MRCRAVAFLAAFLYYGLAGTAALAVPPIDFCVNNPESPLCDPVDPDPVDPCAEDPSLCPVDPEPDPCEVDPASCEPAEPEPLIATVGTLHGSLRVSGRKGNVKRAVDLTIVATETDFTMSFHGICLALTGPHTADLANPDEKFEVLLDEPSIATIGSIVAAVAGDPGQTELGATVRERAKVVVKIREDGTFLVKIRGGARFEKAGHVGLKARYEGAVEAGPIPSGPIPGCM